MSTWRTLERPLPGVQASMRLARWEASLSCARPRKHTYVMSNHAEVVYKRKPRNLLRSVFPSIRTNRLIQRKNWSGVSNKRPTFSFLRLPREIRDSIYSYTLQDDDQETSCNRIHNHSLLRRWKHNTGGSPWYCELSTSPLPRLHTLCILRVCKQVRSEALATLYRTKVLVLTITSFEDSFRELAPQWLPHVSRFLRIRVDLLLACVSPETIRGSFHRVADLLQHRAHTLHFLEVRIGYSHANASATIRDHGLALVAAPTDIADGMRELAPLVQRRQLQII